MGILDQVLQMIAESQAQEQMQLPPRQDQLTPQNMTMFQRNNLRPPGVQGSVPFRDPAQMGPSPPVTGPFASMFGQGRAM